MLTRLSLRLAAAAAARRLWSLQGEVNLRIPWDKGIAGECRTNKKVINIPDAYQPVHQQRASESRGVRARLTTRCARGAFLCRDDRFNQEVDKKTSYHTKTILCMPCLADGKVGAIEGGMG